MNKKTNKSILRTKPLIKTRLVITHWNCLHLPSRVHLLDNFLAQKCPDIVLLNELKIDLSEANIYLDFQNYQFLTKPRNKYGGGVAILIKEGIEFIQDFSYEEFNSELLCIKMNLGKNNELFVFSLYNPPNVLLNFEFFKTVNKTCRNYILGGDLNARTKQIGCVGENENGIILERIINELDFSVINDKHPTFNIFNKNYFEILDLFLVSSSLIDKITDFSVLNSQDMTSDHFPIEASISIGYQLENKSAAKKFNYKKANWQLFSEILNSQIVNVTESSLTIDQLNDKITEKIISASHKSIPYLSQKIYKTSLPPNIVNLIKERRKVRRNYQKTRCQKLKQKFNQLTSELKASLKKFWNQNWFDFIEKMGKNPLTSRPFWKKINKFRTKKGSNLIPKLILNEREFKTNEEKGKCFGELLSSIFSPNSDLIDTEKDIEILNSNSVFFRNYNQSNFNDPICLNELIMALKRLKNEAASGPDQIHNLMLKNLPRNSLIEIIELFNLSLREGRVPKAWKTSYITMIQKKASTLQDPLNYRPISITSCLGKLLERIVYSRLYNFLEQNSLLIQEQSGFRKHRRTADNLFFLIQKIVESFNRKKRVCGLFFDISKAFDRVWHEGLLFKLIKINPPHYLTNWIKSFLDSRTFKVNVNDHLSEEYQITAGVPQGSVISPLLFSIYINDIPKRNKTNNEYSLLFADDLVTFFIYNKKGNLENKINKYLNELEQWLIKWKMKISVEKSCSVVFSRYKKESDNLNLKIYGNRIERQKEIKFLGIKFDSKLNFNILVDEIKERCNKRLNIIKILSNKKWGLNQNTLGNLYKSLVGSILDYSFPCLNSFSENNIKKLQAIQNTAVRSILKLKYDTPSNIVHHEAFNKLKLLTVSNRLFELSERYVGTGLSHSIPLVVRLVKEYKEGFESRYIEYPTPLCNCYLTISSFFPET